MAAPAWNRWMALGRAHVSKGRPVDAMLCYRHAARVDGAPAEVHHRLGEALWRLGRAQEAAAAWREAMRRDAQAQAPAQALAGALLALGDAAGARAVAGGVLTRHPGDARAELVYGVAALLDAAEDHQAAILRAKAALARDPSLLAVPTLAAGLAVALDRLPGMPGKPALLEVVSRVALTSSAAATMPALLLSLLCEREFAEGDDARAALFALARVREFEPGEHEALRRIASAALRGAPQEAPALAQRYASLCARSFAAPLPLVWPRRTAGRRLRVLVLVGVVPDPEVRALRAALTGLSPERFDVAAALIGGQSEPGTTAGIEKAWPSRVILLPAIPDANDAQRLAALDCDALVDLAGLRAGAGVLLALRPARTVLTVADFPARNVPPLIDHGATPARELARLLEERWRALPPDDDVPDASAMAARWTEAVRTQQRGDLAAARECHTRVLAWQPDYAPAHYLLGIVERDCGDLVRARSHLAAAIAAAPGFADARIAAAKAAQAADDLPGAIAVCMDGLAATTQPLALHRALGLARLAARDGRGAAGAFAAALAIDPFDGETHYNHGVALQMQRRSADAAAAYQRALEFRPDLAAAEFNLGVLFQQRGATAPAIAAYESVLAREPANAAAYKNLGEVLQAGGRAASWFANFDRFEVGCPDALALAVQALEVLQHRGDFARLDRYLDGLRAGRFRAETGTELCDNLEQLLYLLLFFDIEPAVVFRYAQMYDAAARRVYGAPFPGPVARRPGRVRLGYLSADLRNHVMGKMMWQAVQHHDRSQFSLHFYALSGERDEWTGRFEGIADRFDVLADLDEREAAARIAADDLDLLVDLSTHTRGAKPGILALKPARVLLTHVASAGTVGLSTVDFKLTDRYADVPENQAFQSETLLPMDGCVYPYRHVAAAKAHPFHRRSLGIAADAILIGAFVTPLKLSRRCLGLWREILERMPHARLAFSPANAGFRDSYARLATAAGIAPDRLFFLPQGRDDAEQQARYELIDFALDPMPFGGVNGTLEALDMGVPVVTLVGTRHGERSSYSILANLGVTATVARTEREYVEIATRLAADAVFMRDVRGAILAGLARSPLTDQVAHARALERAYLSALAARAPEALRNAGTGETSR